MPESAKYQGITLQIQLVGRAETRRPEKKIPLATEDFAFSARRDI
jgi:hypothetical protein